MRQFTNVNYYALLGVMSDASRDEIRAAYRTKARAAHPDAGGDPELFAQIAEAWEVLGNESERVLYDEDRKLRGRTARPYQTRLDRDDAPPAKPAPAKPAAGGMSREEAREAWLQNKRRL